MVCSVCGKTGHYKNNRQFHSKKELEIHHNSILSKKLVNYIFKSILYSCYNNNMDPHTTESQSHGKKYENEIKKSVYGVNKKYSHTNMHDIESSDNNITGKNVSVKSTGVDKKISCSDIVRFLSLNNTEIAVAYYDQLDDCKIVNKTYLLDYDKFIKKLIVDIPKECHMSFEEWVRQVTEYSESVKNIPSGEVEDKWYKKKPPSVSYFNISPKVDSKKQRRVQCEMNFTDFIIQENDGSVLHGKQYNGTVMCGRRIRHPKNT